MKARELIPIFEKITQQIPCLTFHKRMLLIKPMGQLLRGVHVDPSAFSRAPFDLCAFMMPLCERTDHIHLTFSQTIFPDGEDWSITKPDLVAELTDNISRKALPFLQQASTLREFASRPALYSGNPHGPKIAAYAWARIGETRRAIATIEEYLPKLDMSSCWQKDIAEESRVLRHQLIYEPAQAAAKLESWENETIRNLGLERFR